jgi:hypothetical protein
MSRPEPVSAADTDAHPYFRYGGRNYGTHCMCFRVGPLAMWFSYRTLIGFGVDGQVFVNKRSFSNTTKKHRSQIRTDAVIMLDHDEFDRMFQMTAGSLIAPMEQVRFAPEQLDEMRATGRLPAALAAAQEARHAGAAVLRDPRRVDVPQLPPAAAQRGPAPGRGKGRRPRGITARAAQPVEDAGDGRQGVQLAPAARAG